MKRIPKQDYTPEFRELAVKQVTDGQSVGAVARELGLVEQTLRTWVKTAAAALWLGRAVPGAGCL